MEIVNITEKVFAVDVGPTYIAGIRGKDGAALFDTGIDSSCAKKIAKLLDKPVTAVFCTHYHADHTGGNHFFHSKNGADIFINSGELSFMYNTNLSPAFLYGGRSFDKINGKFLKATSVPEVKQLPIAPFEFEGTLITPIPTPGHSPAHTSFIADDILIAGDSVCSDGLIDKYKMLYFFDAVEGISSLQNMKSVQFDKCVFCHKDILDKSETDKLIDYNIKHIEQIKETVFAHTNGNTADEVAVSIMSEMKIPSGMEITLLTIATVKGYLSGLIEEGKVESFCEKGIRFRKMN